jgi:hypothetical protein
VAKESGIGGGLLSRLKKGGQSS